jgi:hypothetical protein
MSDNSPQICPKVIKQVQELYTQLTRIDNRWEGRSTSQGQGLLVVLRDTVAELTGQHPMDVQDEATNSRVELSTK